MAGTPDSEVYCLRNYESGVGVTANLLTVSCWTGSGQPLTSLAEVDRFGLMVLPEEKPVTFEYCIRSIVAD